MNNPLPPVMDIRFASIPIHAKTVTTPPYHGHHTPDHVILVPDSRTIAKLARELSCDVEYLSKLATPSYVCMDDPPKEVILCMRCTDGSRIANQYQNIFGHWHLLPKDPMTAIAEGGPDDH